MLSGLNLPEQGNDFFSFLYEQAKRTVHPDDQDYVLNLIDNEKLLRKLEENNSSLIVFRFVLDGKIMHVCLSVFCVRIRNIYWAVSEMLSQSFLTGKTRKICFNPHSAWRDLMN